MAGERITGNLGTRFPGNPNVSKENLIVNPALLCRENVIHLIEDPNFIRKLFFLTRNKVLVTGKILLVQKT